MGKKLSRQTSVMRAELAKKGICALRCGTRWYLICPTLSPMMATDLHWHYDLPPGLNVKFAVIDLTVTATRRIGTGRGKRPYPRRKFTVFASFSSEHQAYVKYLMMPEDYTWR